MRDMARKRAHDRQRRKLKKQMIQDIKRGRGCADCGYNAHVEALDFDHRGDKKFNVSEVTSATVEQLLEEIAKCDVVCANCHRVRTARRRAFKQGTSPVPTELSVD